jgi:hypothetical protein
VRALAGDTAKGGADADAPADDSEPDAGGPSAADAEEPAVEDLDIEELADLDANPVSPASES